MQKGAIGSVGAPYPRFDFQRFPVRESRVPFLNQRREVFRMNTLSPFPSANFFERLAEKIQPTAIEVIQVSVRPTSVNKRGSRINGTMKCRFIRSRFIVLKGLACLHGCLIPCALRRSRQIRLKPNRRFNVDLICSQFGLDRPPLPVICGLLCLESSPTNPRLNHDEQERGFP
jgi:hypothetical protein